MRVNLLDFDLRDRVLSQLGHFEGSSWHPKIKLRVADHLVCAGAIHRQHLIDVPEAVVEAGPALFL